MLRRAEKKELPPSTFEITFVCFGRRARSKRVNNTLSPSLYQQQTMSSRGTSPAALAPGQEPGDDDFDAVNASVPPGASDDEEDVDVNAVGGDDDDDGAGAAGDDAGAVSEDDDQAEDVRQQSGGGVVWVVGGEKAKEQEREKGSIDCLFL